LNAFGAICFLATRYGQRVPPLPIGAKAAAWCSTMNSKSHDSAIQFAPGNVELIAAFQRVLDNHYHRLIEAARADWERLFDGKDPSDACVTVRIHADSDKKSAVRSAGFLPKPKQAQPQTGKARQSFA
jgi:hypothetical protein